VEWAGFWLALALLVVLRFALPPSRRHRLKGPAAFLFLSLVLSLPARALEGGRVRNTLVLLSAFFLVLAAVRLVFAVVFDWLPLGRDRVPRIVQDVLLGLTYFVVLMGLFGASGVELSSILTTSALLTAVIGLALQDTLGNVIGGLAIQVQRPYTVGDWVSLDGRPENYGEVIEINWRATRLLTNERVSILVPNSAIARAPVYNFSQPSAVVRRSVRISAAYDVPPSQAEEVALRAMEGTPGVLAEPRPECVLEAFGDSGITYWCRFFIDEFRRRDLITGAVAARLYYEFRRAGLEIPYPVRTVHLHERGDEQARRSLEQRVQRLADRFGAVDFLAPLGPEALLALASRVRTYDYGRGESIVRAGETGSDLFLVERGQVSVTLETGGQPREIARLGPGDFFGEMSLMTGEARRATVVAVGDVAAVCVDRDSFREVLSRNPRVVEEMSRVLAQRQVALDLEAAAGARDPEQAVARRSHALLGIIKNLFRL
jgi:small-conductance mechanosensitive channel